MSQRDPNTIDLTHQKLRLAEDVVVWPVQERGKLVYRIEIPSLHRFFRVGYEEYVFISLLDGETTVPQACGLAAAKLGSRAPTSASADAIQRWLLSNDLAYLVSDGPPVRNHHESSGDGKGTKIWSRLNPFWMKVPLPGSDGWVRPWAESLSFSLSRPAVAIGSAIILLAGAVLVASWDRFAASAGEVFSSGNWIWLLITWVALKVVHEMAHAVACHRQGGSVRETGIVLILFAPLAYVDVTSCWRMNSRWSRIAVAAAGMYVELLIAALAILCWVMVDSPQAEFLLHNLVITAGLSTLLFNANALMRFDGYFILADLIEIPNLYSEGSTAVRRIFKQVILGQSSAPSSIGGWRRHFVIAYGFAALIWRVVICVSLAIAASTMFAGAGIVIATLGIFLWFGQPLKQLLKFANDLRRQQPGRFQRGVLVGSTLLVTLWLLIYKLPIPTSVTVPAVATYLPETMVRSGADGFVREIHVRDSQHVRQGELLLELENRELKNRLRQLELAAEQNEIRIRQAGQEHNAAMQSVLKENRNSLDKQIANLRTQAEGLRIVAPRDGYVIAREIALKMGSYAREGDPLLRVAAADEKEVVAVIDQDSIEEVRSAVGSPVWIRTASFMRAPGRLERVDPRATDQLPEESLAATEDGPLDVRGRSEDDRGDNDQPYRLLAPHFRSHIALSSDVARQIPAGMRLTASLGYRTDSLATRLQQWVRRLWHGAQDQAGR